MLGLLGASSATTPRHFRACLVLCEQTVDMAATSTTAVYVRRPLQKVATSSGWDSGGNDTADASTTAATTAATVLDSGWTDLPYVFSCLVEGSGQFMLATDDEGPACKEDGDGEPSTASVNEIERNTLGERHSPVPARCVWNESAIVNHA